MLSLKFQTKDGTSGRSKERMDMLAEWALRRRAKRQDQEARLVAEGKRVLDRRRAKSPAIEAAAARAANLRMKNDAAARKKAAEERLRQAEEHRKFIEGFLYFV